MKKTKILFIIWAILVVIIIGLLTTMGFILNHKYEEYHELEQKLVESATLYARDYAFFEEDPDIVVQTDQLIELDYLDELKTENDVCRGYVIIHYDGVYEYEPFIHCEEYATKGYQEQIKKIG